MSENRTILLQSTSNQGRQSFPALYGYPVWLGTALLWAEGCRLYPLGSEVLLLQAQSEPAQGLKHKENISDSLSLFSFPVWESTRSSNSFGKHLLPYL